MRFKPGCARRLYESGVHPRVLMGPRDVSELRRQVRSGAGRKIMTGLRALTGPMAEAVGDRGRLDAMFEAQMCGKDRQSTVMYRVLVRLWDMAAVGLLDQDARIIESVGHILARISATGPGANLTPGWPIAYGWVLSYDMLYPHLPETVRSDFASWAERNLVRRLLGEVRREHFLRNSGANTPLSLMMNALIASLAVQGEAGVSDLTAEREELITMLRASLHTAVGENGFPTEDIGYGTSVAAGLALVAEAVRRAGFYDFTEECPGFMRFGRALLHFVQPWGEHLCNTGDMGSSIDSREFILSRLATLTGDRTLLWLAQMLSYPPYTSGQWSESVSMWKEVTVGRGAHLPASYMSLLVLDDLRKPVHPATARVPTQFVDRGRGIVSFRSGWKADDTLVVFDGSQRSPSCQGHSHASSGHFSISALGEYFAIDTGRYNMEQNCHNVVLVDGKSGRSTDGEWNFARHHGLLTRCVPGEFVDFAAADSSHQHNCYWARRYMGLVKGRGAPAYVWTVEDVNKADDWAEFWWQLHTSPENTISISTESATIKGWRHGNLLQVHFVLPDPTTYPRAHMLALVQDVVTPSSYKYIPNPQERAGQYRRHSDMLHGPVFMRPRLLAKVSGYNGRFMSLMVPRRKGDRPARVERIPSLDNSLAVRITHGGVEDILIFAYEHDLLEAADVRGRGRWCVVRRERASGRIVAHALGDGTELVVAGRKLRL